MGNYEWTVFRSYDQFVELERFLKLKNLITEETLKKTLPPKQSIESVALTPKEKSELVKELFNSTYSGSKNHDYFFIFLCSLPFSNQQFPFKPRLCHIEKRSTSKIS